LQVEERVSVRDEHFVLNRAITVRFARDQLYPFANHEKRGGDFKSERVTGEKREC
jgi:hypothetical protein